jgi:hypothetical protein
MAGSELFVITEFECNWSVYIAYASDIDLYLAPLGKAMQFIETCGTLNLLCGRKFVHFLGKFGISAQADKKINILAGQCKRISKEQGVLLKLL